MQTEQQTQTVWDQLQAIRPQEMAQADTALKNRALLAMAQALDQGYDQILQANSQDMEAAQGTISPVMLDRLLLTQERISAMAQGIREVAALPDPVGLTVSETLRPNGLRLEKVASPMGVIAIIYESRPNVTSDAAALALKAGSACVLRSGKEAHRSATAIVAALHQGLESVGLSPHCLTLIQDTSRDSATALMTAQGQVDLLIPRGGAGLISACVQQATVPVLETGTGICHAYVDKEAALDQALSILENGKTSRPSVCNALEVCLVHRDIAPAFLPRLWHRLRDSQVEAGKPPVEFRADSKALALLPQATPASPQDFDTEFLDYILAVKVVESLQEAIAHINAHSTGHSETILSQDPQATQDFARQVDSAAVYINASTRFTDGGEFGLGCEMGISTQKLHARGPLGLAELCTYRYIIQGDGQIR